MSERGSEEENQDGGESSSPEWIRSVDGLTEESGPVESREFYPDLDHLGEPDIDFLNEQTSRTLDRHAEVQQYQRQQAKSVLRATIILIGAIGTAVPFLNSFIQSIQFPTPVHPIVAFFSLVFLILAAALAEATALDLVGIIDSTFDILTPEKTERGFVGSLLTLFRILGPEPADEEAGGGVRSVSILDELAPVIDDPREGLKQEVIVNRLNRIRRNEKSINENSENLRGIYQKAKLALERGVAIIILLGISLVLLGARL